MKIRIAAVLLLVAFLVTAMLSGCRKQEISFTPTEEALDSQEGGSKPEESAPADPTVSIRPGASLAGYFTGGGTGAMVPEGIMIRLSDSGITVDGQPAPESASAVWLSRDIVYYEDKTTYASGNPYGEGTAAERHSAAEAAEHTVVNITAPGLYRISGTLSKGQIRVDLGEDAFTDPTAKVTLVLDNADITCTVAPALLFLNVYECDNGWSTDTASSEVDTADAGANVILAQGSKNLVNGSHVAKIFKDAAGEKKLWKQDAAFYSYMSMNLYAEGDGSGCLDITADNEGLDSELHLTIHGGNINIRAGNDGINTNEDGVSVTTINGGNLHIIAGLGAEGDGIDSNGWLVINGGVVVSSANPAADAGLDSDLGSYVNGGIVLALGSSMDWAESDSEQVTMNLQFGGYKDSGDAIVVTDLQGTVVFAYDPSADEVLGSNTRTYRGAVISCPNFAVGDSYAVYIGGELTGSDQGGIFDTASVTGYTGGSRQGYSGTDVAMRPRMGGFGGFGGGQRPEGMVPPEGFQGGERPQKGEKPQDGSGVPPQGFGNERFPEGTPPEGGGMPGGWSGFGTGQNQPENAVFYMQDKVNFFSGVNNL